jgi:hypothetical protein
LVFLGYYFFSSSLFFLRAKRKSVYEAHLVDRRISCVIRVLCAVHHRSDDGRLIIHVKNASVNFHHVVPLWIICEYICFSYCVSSWELTIHACFILRPIFFYLRSHVTILLFKICEFTDYFGANFFLLFNCRLARRFGE